MASGIKTERETYRCLVDAEGVLSHSSKELPIWTPPEGVM